MKLSLSLIACFHSLSVAFDVRFVVEKLAQQNHKRLEREAAPDDLSTGTHTQDPPERLPWWKWPNIDNGEMNALTGQQLRPFPGANIEQSSNYGTKSTDSSSVCHIKQCRSSGILNQEFCGQHARCIQDYCRCDLGWKPADDTVKARGWIGLEAVTVWVDAYDAGCTERCDSLSCAEVIRVEGCFGNLVTGKKSNSEDSGQQTEAEGLATDGLNLGAIKAPGVHGGV